MNSAKRNYVLNVAGIVPKKSAGPTSEQGAGKQTTQKDWLNTRFKPQKRGGKYEVGSGKLHRKGFKQ